MTTFPGADPGVPDGRSAARYLRWLMREAWPSMAGAIAFGVLWMACQAAIPAVVGRGIDAATRRDRHGLVVWSLVLLGLGLGQAAAGVGRHRNATINYLSATYRTVQVTVQRAGQLGSSLPRRLDTGEVIAIGTADLSQISLALDIAARGSGSLVAVVAVTVILLTTSVPLGLVVLLGVPLLMAVVALLIRPLHRRQHRYREQQGALTGRAADLVGGLRVLRGVGGEAVMAGRYRAGSQRLREHGVRTAHTEALLEAAQVLLPGIFLVLVTWLGARFALRGQITVGQLVSFYAYAAFLVTPLRQLIEAIDKFTRAHVAAARVVTLLGAETDLPDPREPARSPSAQPSSAQPPRDDLADPASGVVVRRGQLTAIAAAAPADAVAIADRLGRYAEGGVLGGVPLAEFALADVRERVLVGDNDARLFSGPLRADLDPDGSGRAPLALRAADATDIVDALPGGLHFEVAERGRTFSGGQQQRLRLARALVADPEFLVLVEPTSAVDAHTEARIADRLRAARSGRTTAVCTTSPLVLDRCDRVLYVEGGVVIAEGGHHDLLRSEPRYARTVLRETDETDQT